jgi:site-specific DNA recombinase
MLYNERYAGIWRFKERQWVKVPGTNRRLPRDRDASEVITSERPDLRLIDADVWHRVTQRLSAVRNKYTKDATRMRTNYLFSGVLVCETCERPLTIVGGSSSRYYRCTTSRSDTKCANARHIKEGVARTRILDAIHARLASRDGKKHVREAIAKILASQANDLDTRIKERRERITKTGDQIAEMVEFVKRGERSETIGSSLREMESYLRAEKATLSKLIDEQAKPTRLPTVEDVARLAFDLDKRLAQDIEAGRAQLIRWLRTGSLRVSQANDGTVSAKGALNLRAVLADAENSKPAEQLAGSKFGRYTEVVAGAGFEPATFGL